MSDRRHYNDSLPREGSIQQGKVIRLEPSFCILQLLDFHRMRGLLHVSEMSLSGAKVDEAMSLDDVLYCKVLSVTAEEGPEGRPRHRIKLSTRDVDTETGEPSVASTYNPQQQQLSQNLNSTIGMGVALDPMAASNLILKHDNKSSGSLINGYALVDDTEGEPDLPPPEPYVSQPPMGRGRGTALPAWMTRGDGPTGGGDKLPSNEGPRPPMGRGRGTTLPAWMTRGDSSKEDKGDDMVSESRHGKHGRKENKKHSRKRDREDRDRHHHSRKHHRRDERRSSHRSRSRDRDDDSRVKRHRKKHHRREDHSREDRRRSSSFDSDRNDSRRGEKEHHREDRRHSRRRGTSLSSDSDRSRSRHRKKHGRKSGRRSHSDSIGGSDRNEKRPRSESERSRGHERSKLNGKDNMEFSSVAEAERLISELEDKKRRGDEGQ